MRTWHRGVAVGVTAWPRSIPCPRQLWGKKSDIWAYIDLVVFYQSQQVLLLRFAMMSADVEEKPKFERLPTNVVPVNYRVELHPNLDVFTFKGKLEITAKVASY